MTKKILLLAICYLLFAAPATFAQNQPIFMTGWKAYNFIPPGFNGKAFPLSKGTTIDVSFEILNGNKPVNISGNTVKFFVNDKKYTEGAGLRGFRFVASDGKFIQTIKILVLNNRGLVTYNHTFNIPTASPEIVIDNRYSSGFLNKGLNYFRILPYFFNIEKISDLSFSWSVNGTTSETPEENPEILELNIPEEFPSRSNVIIRAGAQNRINQLEIANEFINLKVK